MKHKIDGVCSKAVTFAVAGGKLTGVQFEKGCPGNLEAMARLLEGMPVDEAVRRLKGITCGDKPTSCSDQLARAVDRELSAKKKKK
jgi:uncharacterized protein (TIGR03905 family)